MECWGEIARTLLTPLLAVTAGHLGTEANDTATRVGGIPALLAQADHARLDVKTQRPNILFILADDLGWGDLSMHGSPIRTPHIDQLAREGIELTQHFHRVPGAIGMAMRSIPMIIGL